MERAERNLEQSPASTEVFRWLVWEAEADWRKERRMGVRTAKRADMLAAVWGARRRR